MSIDDFNRGWRAALNALALRFDHPDLPAVPRWMHAELVALLNAPPSCAPPERGAATAATCKTCGGTKVVLYCRCGCGLTADAAAREAMNGPAALNREQAEANIPTEERPCPDCATPQQAATGTGGDAAKRVVLGCVHGRPPGQPCPHCMGIGALSRSPADEWLATKLDEARREALGQKSLDFIGGVMMQEKNSGRWNHSEQAVWVVAMSVLGEAWRALAAKARLGKETPAPSSATPSEETMR